MRSFLITFRAFLQGAWRRLPVETGLVAAAAVSAMLMVHELHDLWIIRVLLATLIATPLAFSLHGLGRRVELAGGAAAFGLVLSALAVWLSSNSDLDREAFLWPYGLALVAATLVPFVVAARRFTGFVRRFFEEVTTWTLLWGAAITAIVVVCVALDELFDLPTKRLAADLVLVATGAVVLLCLDRLLPDHAPTGRMPQLWRRLAAGIGAPFVAVMLVILVAYEASVLIRGELPRNVLSPLIMGAGFVGFLCVLILDAVAGERVGSSALAPADAHPFLRGRSIRIARAFPAVLLLLLPMAAWALDVRIEQYGLTPFRVVRAASLACLGVLGALGTWRLVRGRAPLSWQVPAIVGAFAVVTGFGPMSAVSLSVGSQAARLGRLLDEVGLPRQIPQVVPAKGVLVASQRVEEVRDAIATLVRIGGDDALRSVLSGNTVACTADWSGPQTCLELLGLTPEPGYAWGTGYAPPGAPFRIEGGELSFVDIYGKVGEDFTVIGDRIVFRGTATASLAAHIAAARTSSPLPAQSLVLKDVAGHPAGQLIVQQLQVRGWSDGRTEVERLTGLWLR